MDDSLACQALVEFTGLDEESTKTQILPYLKSLKTRAESEDYLKSLIGQGTKQDEFIQRYCNPSFQKKHQMAKNLRNDLAFPSLPSTHKPSQPSFFNSSTNLAFTNNRRSNSKQTRTSKTESAVPINQTIDSTVYNNFGNSANVYMKTRDSGNPSAASSNIKKTSNSAQSESIAPASKPPFAQNIDQPKPQGMAPQIKPASDLPPDIDIPISEMSPSRLKEILELNLILESMGSPTSIPKGTAQCFCQARDHAQPSSRLPKQCVNCGLIFCRLKPALSPCPSCDEPSRLSKNPDLKDGVRSEVITQRNFMIQDEIEKYKKRLSLEHQKEALAREAQRDYPTLPTKPSGSSIQSTRVPPRGNTPSYSNQLNGSHSIQNQIQRGYERLAQEFDGRTLQSPHATSASKFKSHTVVRLRPNGKAKIITTTQKNVKNEPQELNLHQAFDAKLLGISDSPQVPPYVDQLDDYFRTKSNLNPVLFVENESTSVTPKYVAVDVYQV